MDNTGYGIPSEVSTRTKHAMTSSAWEIIRQTVGSLHLPSDWQSAYHERSLTLRSAKRGATIKITLDAHVFIDIRVGKGEYRSKKVKALDMQQACEDARQVLLALN